MKSNDTKIAAGGMKSYHVGIAAEALVASLFAQCGYDVLVQYGANQPGYDLAVIKGESHINVSVKGSQDGGWALYQNYLTKGKADYHMAIGKWLENHSKITVFALVQFEDVKIMQMPEVYLATPKEIAEQLKAEKKGTGDTVLWKYHTWERGRAKGTVDQVPDIWKFNKNLVEQIFSKCTK